MPYLFQALFVLDEGLAPLILRLIHSALSGMPPAKEEGASPEALEPRTHAMSRSARRKELEEHRRAKEKSKEKEKETKVVVVGKLRGRGGLNVGDTYLCCHSVTLLSLVPYLLCSLTHIPLKPPSLFTILSFLHTSVPNSLSPLPPLTISFPHSTQP